MDVNKDIAIHNGQQSLLSLVKYRLVTVIVGIFLIGPLSNFIINFVGWVVRYNSEAGFTSSWHTTYLTGVIALGPVLTLLYFVAHRWPYVSSGLTAIGYAGLAFVIMMAMAPKGQLIPKDFLVIFIWAIVGFAAGYCFAKIAKMIPEYLGDQS